MIKLRGKRMRWIWAGKSRNGRGGWTRWKRKNYERINIKLLNGQIPFETDTLSNIIVILLYYLCNAYCFFSRVLISETTRKWLKKRLAFCLWWLLQPTMHKNVGIVRGKINSGNFYVNYQISRPIWWEALERHPHDITCQTPRKRDEDRQTVR